MLQHPNFKSDNLSYIFLQNLIMLCMFVISFHLLSGGKQQEGKKEAKVIKKENPEKCPNDEWTDFCVLQDNFVEEHRIKFTAIEYRSLLEGLKHMNEYPALFLHIVQSRITESSYGITAKEAGELLARYKVENENQGKEADYRWWHVIGGLVVDYWNFTPQIHGIAECYYGKEGRRPKTIGEIQKCVWLRLMQNQIDNSDARALDRDHAELFLANIPREIREVFGK